jgi:hypothetical protein
MRVWAAAVLILCEVGCADDDPGLLLHVEVQPAGASAQVARLVVTVHDPSGTLPMRDESGAGVLVHTDADRATLTFYRSSFAISDAFDVLLAPTGHSAVTVTLSGAIYQADGQPLGAAAETSAVTLAPDRRTQATLAFQCTYPTCSPVDAGAPPGAIDLATPPASPLVLQVSGVADGDRLVPLAIGRFSPGSAGDLVMAAPDKGVGAVVYLFRNLDFSAPGFSTSLSGANADLRIFARGAETLGDSAAVGDFDGDGIDDLALGATNAPSPTGGANAGAAYVISGTKLAQSGSLDLDDPTTFAATSRILAASAGEQLGTAVALAHVRSPAFADLLVSAPGARGSGGATRAGRVYVVYGTSAPLQVTVGDGGGEDAIFYGPTADSQFGLAIAGGDLDGDGHAEVAIGNTSDLGKGTIHVVRGERVLPGSVFDFSRSPAPYDLRIVGTNNSQLGWSMAIADVDGDGHPEIVAGARGASTGYVISPTAALLGPGEIDLGLGEYAVALVGPTGSSLGTSIAGGDLDGDGLADLIFGAPGANGIGGARVGAGACYVVRGAELVPLVPTGHAMRALDTAPPALVIYGAAPGDQLGDHVLLGDFDRSDDLDEIIVGARQGGLNQQGVVYVIQDLPAR